MSSPRHFALPAPRRHGRRLAVAGALSVLAASVAAPPGAAQLLGAPADAEPLVQPVADAAAAVEEPVVATPAAAASSTGSAVQRDAGQALEQGTATIAATASAVRTSVTTSPPVRTAAPAPTAKALRTPAPKRSPRTPPTRAQTWATVPEGPVRTRATPAERRVTNERSFVTRSAERRVPTATAWRSDVPGPLARGVAAWFAVAAAGAAKLLLPVLALLPFLSPAPRAGRRFIPPAGLLRPSPLVVVLERPG